MAYWGCNREAPWVEEFESYLPRSMFGWMVTGNVLAGDDGGGGACVVGGAGEGELGVVERRAHEHRESVRKLLGKLSCSDSPGFGRSAASLEPAGGGAEGQRRLGGFWWDSARVHQRCHSGRRPQRPRRDNDPGNDLDGFSAFSSRLRAIQWPATFKPTRIEKYDGELDAKTWLRTYSITVRAARGDNDIMAAYFPVMIGPQALNWLEALPAGSISSWQDLCNAFVQYYQPSCPGPKTRWDLASVVQQPDESLRDYKRYFANRNTITEADDRDVIHYFNEGLHNMELWRKMFETYPKTVGDMLTRDNRSERRRDDRPPRHGKKHDRAESSKNRDRKRGPENTVAIAKRSQFRSTLNQVDLDRLLDGKCPWHNDAKHTARECRALSNGVIRDDDPKKPRREDCDRRDDDDQREVFPGNFQEEDRAVNFIYCGPSKPSCWRKLKLDDRETNLVLKHLVEPLRWSEMPITFDRRDHWVHLPRPGAYPLVVSPVVSQVRLAKVLVDGGSALDIIFASML
ncbi:uncharacterized protein LOC120679735 [Panicum virgatum]|uniref:uncharacterized protein LOC120679735 n=1 Tax=Panicum virgatum TaxID=38727 RepID=UPI0019D5A939|nr:uncharacterized protein LOC120679735 [Panicum virgatum]